MQNPLSIASLTKEDIVAGLKFVWYTPGDPDSVKRGRFTSNWFIEEDEDMLIRVNIDGKERTIELCVMGITSTRDGRWLHALTVAPDDYDEEP